MTPRWAVPLLLAVLTGCATGAPVRYPFAAATGTSRGLRALGSQVAWERSEGPSVPSGWPHLASSQEVLAPFLACATPAQFVALQRGVDMPRLVEALEDWEAVRLGALGPLRADAAEVLNRKRAAFLVTATEEYGVALSEVFALFVVHSAFDDELRQVVARLARDKQLGETLGQMGTVREELRRRGLKLSEYPERAERAGDVLRGLGRAGRDALATSDAARGALYLKYSAQHGQLPPPYQQALDAVERARMEAAFSPGNVALGGFDSLTFGVPLGFYHLAVGTGRGAYSLAQGRYEQATRELAPAALMVALFAGGKGLRALSEASGTGRLQVPALDVAALKGVVERLGARLGADGMGQLARYIQASREAALLVCEGGEAAAVALHEARGDVARAQAWLSEARPPRAGPTLSATAGVARSLGGMASLVDEAAGLTPEVLEAKLAGAELESTGPRFSGNAAVLEKQLPSLDAPEPGVPEGSALWREYVAYCERRLAELQQRKAVRGPLRWEGYQRMRGLFARGLAFERLMVSLLRADAALPKAQRRWLRDFHEPRIETHVGVAKSGTPGIRFTDVLVIEQQPPVGQPPRVETFSFKSRDLSQLGDRALTAQMIEDANAALRYYGETLNILRKTLRLETVVRKVHLIYEGGGLKPAKVDWLKAAMENAQKDVPGVEVSVQ